MLHVCLDIDTPAAEGQGQYGTAHWLPKKERDRVFTVIHVDHTTSKLRELVEHGRDDLEGYL